MRVIGRTWAILTDGERMSALKYAEYLTRMKWLRINLCGAKKQSPGVGPGRL